MAVTPYRGRVRWFNDAFGYGFLTHGDGQDVFVHHSVINPEKKGRKTLKENQRVRYSYAASDQGGLKALEIRTNE